jgi:hypothetical protein
MAVQTLDHGTNVSKGVGDGGMTEYCLKIKHSSFFIGKEGHAKGKLTVPDKVH